MAEKGMDPRKTSRAVFHVTECGNSVYFRVDRPLELLDTAAGVCAHNAMKKDAPRLRFQDYYAGAELCTKADFDRAVSERMDNTGAVSGAFEIDFDRGEFSALHIMDGWKTFRVEDVCRAMRKVTETGGLDRDKLYRVLTDQLSGKELRYDSPPDLIAVFHVAEKQTETWFSLPCPLESVYAAACLRSYLLRQPSHQAETFGGYLQGARAMSRNDYEWYTANLLGHGDLVAQVYDLDLDRGAFSVLHKNGWRSYPIGVVCDAAHQAGSLTELSSVPEPQRYLDRIAGQEIRRDDLEICIRGDRHLDPGEISFSDEVVQMERLLNFYIDVCFLPDVVLGTYVCTDENDDYVNIYANYDLERGALCDALDVTLWRGDDSFVELKYRLSPEEKELLLPRMEEYCLRQTGMTLGEWHEQYRQETAAEFRQDAPAQGMEPQM